MLSDERLNSIHDRLSNTEGYEAHLKNSVVIEMIDEIRRLRSVLSSIAEVIPEYASEAWMVQEASDALGVKNDER
jgi:hypothetical protein